MNKHGLPKLLVVVVLFATAGILSADDSDDSLRLLLNKSDLVAAATIIGEPEVVSTGEGVVNYIVELRVKSIIQGEIEKTNNLTVNVVRFESSSDERPNYIKKGKDCIFFLRKVGSRDNHAWMTSDCWFGLQPLTPTMYRTLTRLAK